MPYNLLRILHIEGQILHLKNRLIATLMASVIIIGMIPTVNVCASDAQTELPFHDVSGRDWFYDSVQYELVPIPMI